MNKGVVAAALRRLNKNSAEGALMVEILAAIARLETAAEPAPETAAEPALETAPKPRKKKAKE